MKRIIISILVLAGIGGLIGLLSYRPKGDNVAVTKSANTSPSVAGSSTAPSGSPVSVAYKDGSYTGTTSSNIYGPVQVQAVISGGKLTDVKFLQMPSDRDESVRIASQAEPLLLQEAVQAQSAGIDTLSGATQDTESFVESLNSALDQAKA